MPSKSRPSVSKPKRGVEKIHKIIRIEDSPTGRKRFQMIEGGERYSERRALTDRIVGPNGLKVGQTYAGPSKRIHNDKGHENQDTFSERKKKRIRFYGANRDPRKFPHRKNANGK